jgi:hypothetical protein
MPDPEWCRAAKSADVSYGSWLCKNSNGLDGDRRNRSSNWSIVAQTFRSEADFGWREKYHPRAF